MTNEFAFVQDAATATGDLIKRDATAFTDLVAWMLSKKDSRWGRKARINGDWASRNNDGLAWRESATAYHVVDIVLSGNNPGQPPNPAAAPSWQEHLNVDNGFWIAAQPVSLPEPEPEPEPDPPTPDPPPATDPDVEALLKDILAVLREIRDGQTAQTKAVGEGIAELKQAVKDFKLW